MLYHGIFEWIDKFETFYNFTIFKIYKQYKYEVYNLIHTPEYSVLSQQIIDLHNN